MPSHFHALLYFLRINYLNCHKLPSFEVLVVTKRLRQQGKKKLLGQNPSETEISSEQL